jgi:hypothetical protein
MPAMMAAHSSSRASGSVAVTGPSVTQPCILRLPIIPSTQIKRHVSVREGLRRPVSLACVQVDDSPRVCDRVRGGMQRGCLVQGLVGSVLVVEAFVLAQGGVRPYEAAVEEFVAG